MKKILMAVFFMIAIPQMALAVSNDWNGLFTVKMENNSVQTVTHAPNKVHFMFFTAGGCINIYEGTSINGVVFKDTLNLCTSNNVDDFSAQVEKLGTIIKKSIELGSDYSL